MVGVLVFLHDRLPSGRDGMRAVRPSSLERPRFSRHLTKCPRCNRGTGLTQQYNFPDSGWDIISEEARRVVTLLLCGPPRNRLTSQRLLEEDFVTHPERLPEVPLQ